MIPALNLPLSSKKRKLVTSSLEAGGVITDKVQFERRGVRVEANVEYPKESPSVDTDRSLLTEFSTDPKVVYCPGCSNQDVSLERCHGNVLVRHLRTKYPDKQPPKAVGMQGIIFPAEIIALIDDPDHFFIGRRPPRGMPTKSIGVQKTLKRSIYANPFVVSKSGFELGESLKLYEHWIAVDARPLTAQEVQHIVNEAPKLPDTLEEMMIYYPQLFDVNTD